MIIKTRFFGEIDIVEQEVLTFPSGLIGMKNLKRFVLLNHQAGRPFRWLQSLDDANVSFLSVEPRFVRKTYRVPVQKELLMRLRITKPREAMVLCLVAISKESGTMTVNFQAPLLIHMEGRIGKQIILVDGPYHRRHDILQELKDQSGIPAAVPEEEILDIKNGHA